MSALSKVRYYVSFGPLTERLVSHVASPHQACLKYYQQYIGVERSSLYTKFHVVVENDNTQAVTEYDIDISEIVCLTCYLRMFQIQRME